MVLLVVGCELAAVGCWLLVVVDVVVDVANVVDVVDVVELSFLKNNYC